jgi:hypothetical protein
MECYRELQLKHRPLTCHTLKALFLGEEQPEHTLCSLVTYHNTNMTEVLSPGTLKNYFTTEKYVKLCLQKKYNRKDIYLSELNYQFISEFEFFLRRSAPLQANNPLANNGIMKHMERLRKLVTLAVLLSYLQASRNKFHDLIAGMTSEIAGNRWVNEYKNSSVVEMLVYNMRHVQHHAAQLNILLRQGINDAPKWISQTIISL